MNQFVMLGCLWLGACATAFSQEQTNGVNYQLGPIPSVHKPLAENSVPMGNIQTFEEVKLDLPITSGPYEPTWRSIEANYPGTPEWLRDSKFGIWIHFGPQSAGESGDWYARKMYVEGTPAYENHLKNGIRRSLTLRLWWIYTGMQGQGFLLSRVCIMTSLICGILNISLGTPLVWDRNVI